MREAASFIASQAAPAAEGLVTAILREAGIRVRSLVNRRSVARLSEFDDRMLADIGLSRQDVDWALHLPFSADPSRELEARRRRNHEDFRGWRA